MVEFYIDKKKTPKLENAILIEGLPGIGNVARVAVDFLIDKLDAEEYAKISSDCFPKSVFIEEDSIVRLPSVKIYYKKRKDKRDLVFLIGDVQPQDSKDNYKLIRKILELSNDFGVKEIITLGGIGMREPSPEKIHGAVSDEEIKEKFKKYDLVFDGNGTVNLIVGAAGLLIGLGKKEGIKGISLLSETEAKPGKIGVESSRNLLKVLERYLELELPLKELEGEIGIPKIGKKQSKRMEKLRKVLKKYTDKEDQDLSYIG